MKSTNITVSVNGIKTVLTDKNYLSSGAFGDVYRKDAFVYKIYQDLKNLIPIDKMKELHCIDRDNILIPKEQIFDNKNKFVGFTMNFIDNTVPLCKLFTNSFWTQNGVTPTIVLDLIKNFQSTMQFIHTQKCLVVDCNEFNFLINEKLNTAYFIDVDSYQTENYPAVAIMDSIRDWHTKKFNENSDWFSFGILACQLLIGIHPYKGTHPNFEKKDLEKRMKSNVSIFNKDVTIPQNTRNFNNIPNDYKEWFKKIFELGERLPPPYITGQFIVVRSQNKVINSTDKFEFKLIKEFSDNITFHKNIFNKHITFFNNKFIFNNIEHNCDKNTHVILIDENIFISADIENNVLKFNCNKYKCMNINISASKKFICENRLYAVSDSKIIEIQFKIFNNCVIPNVKNSWDILENATQIHSEFCITNIYKKMYLNIFYYDNKNNSNRSIVYVKELDGYKILNAKKSKNVIIFTLFKDNLKYRLILKFDNIFEQYTSTLIEDIDNEDVNFVTLDKGICVQELEDKVIEIFYLDMNDNRNLTIKDKNMLSNGILSSDGQILFIYLDNKLYSFEMKK